MSKVPGKSLLVVLFVLLSGCGVDNKSDFHADLAKKVETTTVAKGVVLHKVHLGEVDKNAYFHLSSGIMERSVAKDLQKKVKDLDPKIVLSLKEAPEKGPLGEELGVILHIGQYKTADAAKQAATFFKQNGMGLKVRYSVEDGFPTTGPFNASVVEVDPKVFEGRIISALAQDRIPGKETTSSIGRRHKALVATNAGFFTYEERLGTVGDPAGISIIDGEVVSEPAQHRPMVLLDNSGAHVGMKVYHNVIMEASLTGGANTYAIDGINREPGKSLNCGNIGDIPADKPIHDFLCTDPDEIILFNAHFGTSTPRGKGTEVILQGDTIQAVYTKRGHPLKKGEVALQATGKLAQALMVFQEGQKAEVMVTLSSAEGKVALKKGMYALNGGPTLVKDGEIDFKDRATEGFAAFYKEIANSYKDEFVDKKDQSNTKVLGLNDRRSFYYGWVLRRHPRTAIGVTAEGKIILAVIYGRQAGREGGASITEIAQLMKSYGAVEAMNLDGGGSSMMTVLGRPTGKSSDKTERPDADAVLILER